MSASRGSIEPDRAPPLAVPLRHLLVALGFLLAGGVVGALEDAGVLPGRERLAHVHLLLAGWMCVTVAGAMTQFVPVWSGLDLHSRRLATVQLWLLAPGPAGFAAAFLTGRYRLLPVVGVNAARRTRGSPASTA
jgi:hypothetical protein